MNGQKVLSLSPTINVNQKHWSHSAAFDILGLKLLKQKGKDMEVYVLHHVYKRDESEESKMLGVYSTRERAEEAIERLKVQPGFVDYPTGFEIDPYNLDEDEWEEGFVTVT